MKLPNASRSAAADALVALINGGAGPGTVQVRTGSQPADPNGAATGTVLATFTLSDPAFGAAVNGVATCDITPALTVPASAGGDAGWFRVLDSNGATVEDGSCSATGGGGEFQLNTLTLVSGVDVTITQWTITCPAS